MTGLSYVHGASDVPLLGETVGAHFDRAAALWPDRRALIVREQGVRWSYAELQAQVDAFAAGLLALGLEPGDRVGIWSPNNAEWVVTQFATAKAGLILVNINPAYRTHELNKVGCRVPVPVDGGCRLGHAPPQGSLTKPIARHFGGPRVGGGRYARALPPYGTWSTPASGPSRAPASSGSASG